MVAIFAAISEVAMAYVIVGLPDKLQEIFIWFVMGFPTILVVMFFFTLYRKPAVFFAPGDYKKEELYVNSIGLNKHDDAMDLRVKMLEDTIVVLQDFLEKVKFGTTEQVEFAEVRKSIQRQQELETNPLYAFITGELQVKHEQAQRLIAAASDALELTKLFDTEMNDPRRTKRLSGLITTFPSAVEDFKRLKLSVELNGERK